MPSTQEFLRQHLEYTRWASGRLVKAAGELPAEELTRDFQTADKSVLGTLLHVFQSERRWLLRLTSKPPYAGATARGDESLSTLETEWPALSDEWMRWVTAADDERLETAVEYVDLKGKEWVSTPREVILHMVNHGTHHRGQVAGFLRMLGHTPPPLDLIAYYRLLGA